MDTNTLIVLLIGVVIVVWILQNQSCSENYGQDASIRASAGWLAGPKGLYGYDPIDHYADQIAEMERRNLVSSPLHGVGPEEYTERYPPYTMEGYSGAQEKKKECMSCLSTEEFEMMNS